MKHSIDHDEWQDMRDMLEDFQNKLAAFETRHPTALYKIHWRSDPDFPKRRDIKPIGDVFEALKDAVEGAEEAMPNEPEEFDQAEYDADFKGKQEREERGWR